MIEFQTYLSYGMVYNNIINGSTFPQIRSAQTDPFHLRSDPSRLRWDNEVRQGLQETWKWRVQACL